MILRLENQDLSLFDICPVGATFLFPFFPLEQRAELVAHFSLLRTYPFHAEEKVSMLHDIEFRSPWDGHEHSIVRIQALA
ncbi:hypothetical protein BHE74_00058041 [Ensete ventricosum]|nr:hypothetical protein GW17_00040029 [Ensete ventricosum]RWW36901.1 hypothetical protein BHE74_00058041 [Ensete ventricosum]RZR94324.1 hypothetical protein BHM03_00023003 [Ensete ventricosum]